MFVCPRLVNAATINQESSINAAAHHQIYQVQTVAVHCVNWKIVHILIVQC